MRKLMIFVLAFLTSFLSRALADDFSDCIEAGGDEDYCSDCGNDDDPPPGDCEDDDDDCEEDEADDVGYPINPQMADVFRSIPDLATYGAAPISFTRMYNSRTTNFNPPYWEFGWKQTWQHNWNYETRDLTSTTFGQKDIKVRYPSGREDNFTATDSSGLQRVPSAKNGDRLYKWTGSTVGHTLVKANGWEYDFKRTTSPKYRLEQVRNGQGLSWTLTYNTSNQLERVENNFGRWIEIERETGTDGVECIKTIRSSDGREVNYSYDSWIDGTATNSLLSAVTYPDASQALYTYVGAQSLTNGRPLIASAVDPQFKPAAGAKVKWTYNYEFIFDFGNGPFLTTGVVSNELNLVTDEVIVSLPLGAGGKPKVLLGGDVKVGRVYNTFGRLGKKTDGEGRATYYTHEQGGAGHLASRMDASSNVTSYVRDYAGRVTQRIDPMGQTNSLAYDTAGFVITNTDALGRSTTYTRGTNNLPTRVDHADGSFETWTHNQYGQVLTHRLRNSGTETFAYYSTNEVGGLLGDLKTRTDALGNTSTLTWTAGGLIAGATDVRGNTTSIAYDWRGNVLTNTHPDGTTVVFAYDASSKRTNAVDELGHATAFTYDEYNRLKTVTDPLGRTTSYEYGRAPGCTSCGSVSLVSRITDPAGKVTEFSYDGGDKRTNETSAAGTAEASSTTWTYDAVGRLKTQTDANGHTYTWVYDALGRATAETNALGQATTYTYDAVGNRLARTDGAGVTTSWTYDDMNGVTATGSGTLSYEYGYDSGRRRTTMKTKVNGTVTETTTYTYDVRNFLLTKVDPSGFSLSYGYDAVGNRTNLTIGSVLSQSYTYDNRNRVSSITGNGKTTSFSYDAASRLLSSTLPNGTIVTNAFDNANQLLSRVHVGQASLLASFEYDYDLSGNRTNMTTLEGVNSYTYDAHNWLTSAAYPDGRTQQFEYDPAGNRGRLTDNGNAVDYTYDAANRLTSEISVSATNSHTYDGAGRLIGQTVAGQTRSYAYSFRSQMTSLTDTNDAAFNYDFDGDGNRTKQSLNSCLTERFVYDGPNVVLDLNASNQVVHAYVNKLGIDQHIERLDFVNGNARNRYVYHEDALRSVVAMTDSQQQVAKSYSYEAFGKIRLESGQYVIDRYTYTGREAIGDSLGLYYYRWRLMDSNVGRLTSEDPMRFLQGVNPYVAVMNNPLRLTDRTGLCCTDEDIATDTANYNDCVDAVEIDIGNKLEEWDDVYEEVKDQIYEAADKLSKDCESSVSKDNWFYDEIVFACQSLVSAAEGLNLAAAFTTFEAGKAALGIALNAGKAECGRLNPCAE